MNCQENTGSNPKARRVVLVRHGETDWNRLRRFQGRSDVPLNQNGDEQARALAVALRDERFTAIYSSPLERALETARHIGRYHPSVPLFTEPSLMEMDLGEFEGMEARQWALQHQQFRKAWEEKPGTLSMPGGESLHQVQQRTVEALVRIVTSHEPDTTLLICAHNFVIVSMLCYASGIGLDRFRELRQDTAALNVLYTDGVFFQVAKVNDSRHLQKIA